MRTVHDVQSALRTQWTSASDVSDEYASLAPTFRGRIKESLLADGVEQRQADALGDGIGRRMTRLAELYQEVKDELGKLDYELSEQGQIRRKAIANQTSRSFKFD